MKLPANADALAATSSHLTLERRKQILDHIRASDGENDQSTAKCILKNGGPEADFLKDLAARATNPESGIRNPESGIRNQGSGIPNQGSVPPPSPATPAPLTNPVIKK